MNALGPCHGRSHQNTSRMAQPLRMLLLRKLWRRAGPEDFQPQSTPEAADSATPSLSPGPPGPAGGGGPAAPRAARSVAEQAAASGVFC